jgi:hypothetical protein
MRMILIWDFSGISVFFIGQKKIRLAFYVRGGFSVTSVLKC